VIGRQYRDLLTALGMLGGFAKIISLVFPALVGLISKPSFFANLVRRLYHLKTYPDVINPRLKAIAGDITLEYFKVYGEWLLGSFFYPCCR